MRSRQFLRPMSRLEIRCRMYLLYVGLPLATFVVLTGGGVLDGPDISPYWVLMGVLISVVVSHAVATRLPKLSWRRLPTARAPELLDLVKQEDDIRAFVAAINAMRRELVEGDLELALAFVQRIQLQRARALGTRAHQRLVMIR